MENFVDYLKTLGNLSLGSRLKRLSDQLVSEVSIIYKEMGISLNPNYFPLINLIANMGPMSITQAAQYLSVSHPAISKLTNKMIQDQYLVKRPHPTDKRISQLMLTEQSVTIIEQASPIWKALQKQLDYLDSLQSPSFLQAIEGFEQNVQQLNLSQSVLHDLKKEKLDINIINWNSCYRNDFKKLNMAWLTDKFNSQITQQDKQAIDHPESYYLAQGGYLFFAQQGEKIVGCIAIKPVSNTHYELSKMAVNTAYQGQGIGRKLLLHVLNKTRELQIKTVSLETNSQLKRALALYQNVGFIEQSHPKGISDYERADIYMELTLHV